MKESNIAELCRLAGGTVYETVRMAGPKALELFRKLIDELALVPAPVPEPAPAKPKLAGRSPGALIELAGPILAELKKDPGRHDFFHHNCVGNMNMGRFLIEAAAAVQYSCNGSKEAEEFIEEVEAVAARFSG